MLKEYQKDVVRNIQSLLEELERAKTSYESTPELRLLGSYMHILYSNIKYSNFQDRPRTGSAQFYPRVCVKIPTGGGKTLLAVESIRAFQNSFAKSKTGLIVWITHREQIYRQTIEKLQDKNHPYRQILDQVSGNRTLVLEKGRFLRRQDVEGNLVVMMLMIQSASRESNKLFSDSNYVDFFPEENRTDLHKQLLERIPNLDHTDESLFGHLQIKTSLGNVIRLLSPLIIVDEFHAMFGEKAIAVLDGLNPGMVLGLSATPKKEMNIVANISGRELEKEGMIKLDMHLIPPKADGDWQSMLSAIKLKRESLEIDARDLELNSGIYIRPIALIQVERTGREQRGFGFVHSEDVREYLIESGVSAHEIAVKTSSLDEIKAQKLLSKQSEIRYIITKEALKEGWDCSFAYILGVIPNAKSNSSITQLVGRVLRQPYAMKTGISSLDESYVYFASGDTQQILDTVKNGFESEGLKDVSSGIQIINSNGEIVTRKHNVPIKTEIKNQYYNSLFLPVWLKKEKGITRRFSYKMDIFPFIDWDSFLIKYWTEEISKTIGKQANSNFELVVGLASYTSKDSEERVASDFNSRYLVRRISEITGNAFKAFEICTYVAEELFSNFDTDTLNNDAGYIARELEKGLVAHRKQCEKLIFTNLIESRKLFLGVSDDENIGFSMPEFDSIESNVQSIYKYNLYQDTDLSSLNSLERKVVSIIEQSSSVLWWARNKARAKGWYSVQGWQQNKIWPDFIIAKKDKLGELELVYIVESKGEQLVGNTDSEYKREVFDSINNYSHLEKILYRTTTISLNDSFDFELIPQNEEEIRLRSKLNDKAK